jgi:hypothetical protein
MQEFQKIDFVKMFIVEELLYFISKSVILLLSCRLVGIRRKCQGFVSFIIKILLISVILKLL